MKSLETAAAVLGVLTLGAATQARALTPLVYSGCAQPAAPGTGTQFWVDPVNGSDYGDGSSAHPFRSLQAMLNGEPKVVFATMPTHYDSATHVTVNANPNAPIKPGSTVWLKSGDYGDVLVQGYYGSPTAPLGFDNGSKFITIAAASGASPVLHSLTLKGAGGWDFEGLTAKAVNTGSPAASATNYLGPNLITLMNVAHHDIVINGWTLQTQGASSGWNMAQWNASRMNGINEVGGKCIAVSNNRLTYVGFGIQAQGGDRQEIAANQINYFTDDGIDYGSSDTDIRGNQITNSIEDGDGFHRDAMQGQPYGPAATNVTIINNTVRRLVDRTLPSPAFMQGIDVFDGQWTGLQVRGNLVVTNAANGLSFYGVNGLTLTGNQIYADDGTSVNCSVLTTVTLAACQTVAKTVGINATPGAPRIEVTKSKTGVASVVTDISSNTATGLQATLDTVNPTSIHGNNCASAIQSGTPKCVIGIPVGGVIVWSATTGAVIGVNNKITGTDPDQ